jgi:hypothetical protein
MLHSLLLKEPCLTLSLYNSRSKSASFISYENITSSCGKVIRPAGGKELLEYRASGLYPFWLNVPNKFHQATVRSFLEDGCSRVILCAKYVHSDN